MLPRLRLVSVIVRPRKEISQRKFNTPWAPIAQTNVEHGKKRNGAETYLGSIRSHSMDASELTARHDIQTISSKGNGSMLGIAEKDHIMNAKLRQYLGTNTIIP